MIDLARTSLKAVAFLLSLFAAIVSVTADDFTIRQDIPYKPNAETEYERQRCKLDLYLPASGKPTATLIWFHGGGLKNGHKADDIATSFCGRFVGEGYAVASINYRLSPKVNFPAYIDDAAAAVAFVHANIEKHGGSPGKVFVSGHSAGGYLTLMVGLDGKYLGKYGLKPGDIAGYLPVAGQTVTHSTVREERGIPSTQPIVDAAAPSYHVSREAPPFICFVGDNDLPARAEENRYFVAAMKATGHKDVAYVEVAGRNHGTIASRISDLDDEVAAAMKRFIVEHSP